MFIRIAHLLRLPAPATLTLIVLPTLTPLSAAPLEFEINTRGVQKIAFNGHDFAISGFGPRISNVWRGEMQRPERPVNPETRWLNGGKKAIVTAEGIELDVSYQSGPQDIKIDVEIKNTGSDSIYAVEGSLLGIRFPSLPKGQNWKERRPVNTLGKEEPPVSMAVFDNGTVAVVREGWDPIVRTGFSEPDAREHEADPSYRVVFSTRHFAAMDDPVIEPGATVKFRLSVRFRPGEATMEEIAEDAVASFKDRFPFILNWEDRRPIGRVFVASSAAHHKSETNPRAYLSDPNIDVTTEEGLEDFRNKLLAAAERIVKIANRHNAQGVIVWDLEGCEYPHPITYIGDPRSLPLMSPEMDRFADEFFKILTDGGLRVGVTIRPSRNNKEEAAKHGRKWFHGHLGFDPVEEMSDKIRYAKKRWGISMVYVDTNTHCFYRRDNGKIEGRTMDADAFIRLAKLHPDVLIIPEFGSPAYYSAVGVYHELRGGTHSTSKRVRDLYPRALSWIIPNDADMNKHWDQLVAGVRAGDILSIDAWWDPDHNAKVGQVYQEAAQRP